MIKVRAVNEKTGERFYPEGDSFADLSVFYGILEGERLKGKTITLQYGLEGTDINGKTPYVGDNVRAYFEGKKGKRDYEDGEIDFTGSCFIVYNDAGMIMDLEDLLDDNEYQFEIL